MIKILLLGVMVISMASCISEKGTLRQSDLSIGKTYHGFVVESVADVPDESGRLWQMRHVKNGAELQWLERDDEIKTFAIIFKTIPQDDTGVAHIMEHTVLAGSEKYPLKSPFSEMMKGTLQVFMNAMTGRDVTYYPFSTRYDEDFMNLLDVYLDSVFCPISVKNPLAFMREGWHYEIGEDGKLHFNGIVFNEMKGATAGAGRTMYCSMLKTLFPDTPYALESGGEPAAIPNLTYEDYCAFHAKFYHPSNSRIFLDGSVDIDSALAKLDEYLSKYERMDDIPEISAQSPIETKAHFQYEFANTDRKTAALEAWCAADFDDVIARYALEIIGEYLCGTNESPLSKALINKGLCEEVSAGNSCFRYVPFIISCENTSDEDAEECFKVIREELEKVVEEGFDRERLEALINANEFREREQNTSRPRGLANLARVQAQWLYGGSSVDALNLTAIYKTLRDGLDNGFFERYLKERILDNHHHVQVVVSPSATLSQEKREAEEARCAAIQAKLTPEELNKIKADSEALVQYQRIPDAPEDAAKLPRRRLESVPVEGRAVDSEIHEIDGVTHILTKTTCDGVSYLNLYFPIDDMDADELAAMPLFASAFGQLGTTRRSAIELRTALNADVGRLHLEVIPGKIGNYLYVGVAALTDKLPKVISLLREILLETDFSDAEALEKLRKQSVLGFERNGTSQGHVFALLRSMSGIERRCTSKEILGGVTQLHFLRGFTADEKFSSECAEFAKRIFRQDGMIISRTRNLPEEIVAQLLDSLPNTDAPLTATVVLKRETENHTGYVIAGDSSFAGWAAHLPEGVPFQGSMNVAARIISMDYIHRELREVGGAYGGGFSIAPDGVIQAFSYRDPTPARSYEKFEQFAQALRDFVKDGKDLTPFILGTISTLEPSRSPAQEAAQAPDLYLLGRTPEDLARIRREVLATTPEQLLEFADILEKIAPTAQRCAVGGRKPLETLGGNLVEF